MSGSDEGPGRTGDEVRVGSGTCHSSSRPPLLSSPAPKVLRYTPLRSVIIPVQVHLFRVEDRIRTTGYLARR